LLCDLRHSFCGARKRICVESIGVGMGTRQDNLQVYTQILGLSEPEFIDLMQQGVFE